MFSKLTLKLIATLALTLAASSLSAETRYVSDQFEITLRTGASTSHSIVQMLASGTPLEVISPDDGGYTQVRAPNGATGYVLTRFLMPEPAARDQLAQLRARLQRAGNEQGGMSRQIDELLQQLGVAERRIAELSARNEELAAEIERIREISANAIMLDERSRSLATDLGNANQRIDALEVENTGLRRQASRKWFITGAGVVLLSMLIGIALTRVRWRRRSSWSDF